MNTHYSFVSISSLLRSLLLLVFLPFAAVSAQDGGAAEVLRGRVLDADGRPIPGVSVTITGLQSKIERTTKTNDKGVYTVLFTSAEGEYVVHVRRLGYTPIRQRVLRDEQMGNIVVADFKLSKSTELASVDVKGGKAAKEANGKNEKGIGDKTEELDLAQGKLFSLDPSDLSSLMQGMPGVTYIPGKDGKPGTYSVLGADPSENQTVVDGMSFDGNRLPADALSGAMLSKTSFDPSRGGFSGGQMSYSTRSGSNIWQSSFSGVLSDPRLAWRDAKYPSPLARQQDLSASMSGPLIRNKIFYMAAFQTNRNTSGLQSLLNLKDRFYSQYGLIPDTVRAVGEVLGDLGIPLTAGGIPNQNIRTANSGSLKLDFNPTATTAASVFATGSWSNNGGSGIGPTSYPVMGGYSKSSNGSLMFSASTYFGSILNEFQIGLNRSVNASAPYVLLPGGSVMVASEYEDGRTGLTSLRFGGNSGGGRTSQNTTALQIRNSTSWLTTDTRHQWKWSEEVTINRNSNSAVSDQFGSFVYQSLNDLAANRPTSYSRSLSSQARSTAAIKGAFSLSDSWRATNSWSFQYGLRLDLGRSATRPTYNPVVDSIFNRRTDRVPQDIGLSPRLGFQWVSGGRDSRQRKKGFAQGAYQPGQLLTRSFSPITVSGGIGAFRNSIDPSTIASLVDATGLPNTLRMLNCVGDATPVPDWNQFMSNPDIVPTQCLDGTAPVEFSNDKPSVRLYDPSFKPTLGWNATVNVGGFSAKGWSFGFGTDLRLGFNGASPMDLNLRRTSAFSLANEGNRPVYVAPGAIVAGTGAIAPGASRISDRFGSVISTISDLRSMTSSFTINFQKLNSLFGQVPLNGSYAYSVNRQQFRGLGGGGSTAGDPFAREWAGGTMPTHAFTVSTYYRIKWFNFSVNMQLNSGQLYTPGVSGDLNGDGAMNDRAFVFDPATVSDPAFAQELKSLMSGTSSQGRKCLQSQLGHMAGLNSCKTGWMFQPNINFSITDPSKNLSFRNRLSFSFTTQNMMSVLGRTLGLSNSLLSRSYSMPDPTLFYVDGFDPVSQQFKYRVNQQFGTSQDRSRSRRVYPPFQIGLRARLELGGPPQRTFAQGLGLVPVGKDQELTREEVRTALLKRLMSNPVEMVLAAKDTLLLTEQQVSQVEQAGKDFVAKADSLLDPVENYVVERGRKTEDRELMKRIGKVQPKMQAAMFDTISEVAKFLTEEQIGRLPPMFQMYLEIANRGKKDNG